MVVCYDISVCRDNHAAAEPHWLLLLLLLLAAGLLLVGASEEKFKKWVRESLLGNSRGSVALDADNTVDGAFCRLGEVGVGSGMGSYGKHVAALHSGV